MKSIIHQQTESTIRTAVQYLLIAGSHHEMRMRDVDLSRGRILF